MLQIKIKDICPMAMTEDQGLLVRNAMKSAAEANEVIVLDFDGISLFATMFFNASIGYYIVEKSIDYCKENIRLANISELGRETYDHSFENAKEFVETSSTASINNSAIAEKNIIEES